MTIPGVGECSAMMLLAEIGELECFHDKEALCSYAGLVPRVRESAGKAARGGITRQGSPWLRWMMVEAAEAATRSSPAAKRHYQSCCARSTSTWRECAGAQVADRGLRPAARRGGV